MSMMHYACAHDALCVCSLRIMLVCTVSFSYFMPGWSYLDVFYLYQAIDDCINGQTRNGVYAEFTANVSSVGHNGVY